MPKQIPESVKLEAMRLFLRGETAREIAEQVSINGTVVTPPTIYAWAKREGWKTQKNVARTDQQQKLAETEGHRFARLQQEHLENYTVATNKASRELAGLTFDKASDAVKALDIGIKGQREVLSGLINLQFVQEVLGILVEEVNDQDILNRVALKLKTLVQQQEEER
jgi:hypothetical protein